MCKADRGILSKTLSFIVTKVRASTCAASQLVDMLYQSNLNNLKSNSVSVCDSAKLRKVQEGVNMYAWQCILTYGKTKWAILFVFLCLKDEMFSVEQDVKRKKVQINCTLSTEHAHCCLIICLIMSKVLKIHTLIDAKVSF